MVRTGDKQGPKRTIKPGTRICVQGLPLKVRKTVLQGAFGDFGNVVKIEMPQEQSVAFIEFEDPGDAADAAESMDGKTIEKQRVSVRLVDDHRE